MILVYQFGARAPVKNLDIVRQQMAAAHDYQNDLVRIEIGRRDAIRAIEDTPEVREVIELVKVATRSDRKTALLRLSKARAAARELPSSIDELARIKALDDSVRRDARALTSTYYGTYLTIEDAAQKTRQSMPLYDRDGFTPNNPRFRSRHGRETGQIGTQIQKGLPTSAVVCCADQRVRLAMRDDRYGTLSMRVGSIGREPIFAEVPIKMHRKIPDGRRLEVGEALLPSRGDERTMDG